MNLLLTSVGRRTYLVEYFKEALEGLGEVHVANSAVSQAFTAAGHGVVTPLIYDKEYIPFLLDYCGKHEISLLISLFDIDLPVLSAHREEFAAAGVTVAVSSEEVISICNDKWNTCRFLRGAGIPAPDTWIDPEEAQKALRSGVCRYPVMVKPRWGMGSLAVWQADNGEELEVLYKKSRREIEKSYLKYEAGQAPEACVLIQQKLEGEEYGLDVVNDLDGNYQATCAKRKYAMRSGETDCAETVEIEELYELGKRLGSLLKHKGNLDVDVFCSDGVYYVLEMNARFGGGYPFSHMAGMNLPRAIVNWKLGKPIDKRWLEPEVGVRSQKDIRMVKLCREYYW